VSQGVQPGGAFAWFEENTDEAGFVMLGLAQMVCIFAFWMAFWPSAFGLPRTSRVGTGLGVLFGIGAMTGFYMAFRALSLE